MYTVLIFEVILIIQISVKDSIYHLITTYPEIKDIMKEIGFTDILKAGIIQTVGRIMNLEKGSSVKGISIEYITDVFKTYGFEVK